ncbi:PaaI family thioesterase [Alkalilimnicola ehrlichii MLHE-1]|uniref:Uncharacterized domain 1 n=1 Tax=Alkalilimnicola ehrlichii (strain ATCC BAA-1101 / DSM 17681 / MLHE-1) TaxID=187272 RepID=Q0AAA4_ALKEH|nr:PaaI family thioesterase [Alkalilimnicola ehrlichii]ABI56233.1 uncharacterized domain 1 [Alkalilimnicola ehrlichii MLHE-1]
MTEAINPRGMLAMARDFFQLLPHGRLLGIVVNRADSDGVETQLPYRKELVGDPDTGHLHGGVVTTLIDQTSGAAVLCRLGRLEAVATLDLRVDHLGRAEPGLAVVARGECYRVTPNICFARCTVFPEGRPERPIATSMSSFMRTGQVPGFVEGSR